MNLPLKVLTVKHVAIMIKGLGFLVKKLSSTSFATNPQSVSFISFPLFKFSKIYVRWNQDTFFIMFPLVQLISFLLTHVYKMYQFSYGSHHSLCELKTTLTIFPQVHPINYYLIGKTVGEGGSSTSNVPFTTSPYCPIYWAQQFYTPIHCIAAHSFHIYNISQTKGKSQHHKKRRYIFSTHKQGKTQVE